MMNPAVGMECIVMMVVMFLQEMYAAYNVKMQCDGYCLTSNQIDETNYEYSNGYTIKRCSDYNQDESCWDEMHCNDGSYASPRNACSQCENAECDFIDDYYNICSTSDEMNESNFEYLDYVTNTIKKCEDYDHDVSCCSSTLFVMIEPLSEHLIYVVNVKMQIVMIIFIIVIQVTKTIVFL